jgi:histidinol dehydrogenase
MRIIRDAETARSFLLERRAAGFDEDTASIVRAIVERVRRGGDRALLDITREIDGAELDALEVSEEEFARCSDSVPGGLLSALHLAAENVRSFHVKQKSRLGLEFIEDGLGFLARPLERAGVYVPGGKASYPSTVLMTVIPARVAGVGEVIMATPPGLDGKVAAATLVAARMAGVDRVFKVGGAQAVAAMAYGTETVPRVDKICGPGNVFVTLAKKQVYGDVALDGLHGPTETVIVADDSASPVFCAADLLAQAEHDEMASAVMITTSAGLAEAVNQEIEQQVAGLERQAVARQSIDRNGVIVVVPGVDEAFDLVNAWAPEHLCLSIRDARSCLDRVHHAGGIFIETPEALGDYAAGPSHVMPTGGTARFSSPLSVLDFLKVSILVDLDREALRDLGPASAAIARAEGLTAHALSVERRLEALRKPEGGE